jgi:hypothetical protein
MTQGAENNDNGCNGSNHDHETIKELGIDGHIAGNVDFLV